jgi:dihydroorotate dehydrogenase
MQYWLSQSTHFIYKNCVKPVFFLLDPELVHNKMTESGRFLGKYSFIKKGVESAWGYCDSSLIKNIDGIIFPNPIGLSAGFDYNGDLHQILPSLGFGFHTIGTVTLQPYAGNPKPRLGRFPRSKALLVNKGLKNIGANGIISKLSNVHFAIPTGISIASTNKYFETEREQIEDIAECFRLFENSEVNHIYYELNISCPNTFGGEPFTTPSKLKRLMSAMDTLHLKRPLYIKMPIDQSEKETLEMLQVIDKHNVQGVIFGNLTKDKTNPAVHADDQKEWQTKKGNLSGKPTWERSNNLIQLTRKSFGDRFTIIGTGGVFSGKDAEHKLRLGADLVQLITGMIYEGPQLIGQITSYLSSN